MKLSKYTLFIFDYPTPGEYLLFNTLTQAMAVVNEELKDAIEGLEREGATPEEAENHFETLAELGMLIGDEVDENIVIDHWFNQMKFDHSFFQAVILTTYGCNFGCTYCVEEGVKRNVSMREKTCGDAVQWLIGKLEEKHPKELRVDFYGGEPLLNIPAIEYISKALWEHTQGIGIPFYTTITTNGALLTEAVVDRLLRYGLAGVKVTLDGDREAHNRKRPFKNGRGSFDIIIDNVLRVIDKVGVSVGGNFDSENKDSIPRLLDTLTKKGLHEKLTMVNFKPISASVADRDMGCCSFSEGNLPEEILSLRREAMKRGFVTPEGMGIHSCTLTNDSAVIIDPLGKIYKCPALVGYDDFVVGDIYHDELNYKAIELMSLEPWKACYDCPYVPLCGGGCRFMAYLKHGDIREIACERAYFDRIGKEMLKAYYETCKAA